MSRGGQAILAGSMQLAKLSRTADGQVHRCSPWASTGLMPTTHLVQPAKTHCRHRWSASRYTKRIERGTYSSLTEHQGRRILWYPDRKYFLLGRLVPDELLGNMNVPAQ